VPPCAPWLSETGERVRAESDQRQFFHGWEHNCEFATDRRGVPFAVRLTGANRNDSQEALALVDAIPPLRGERGRPRQRPDCVLGDRGYDAAAIRRGLRARHIAPLLAMRRTQAWEWLGPVAVGRGAHVCLAQSVSPLARAV
jgi:hypothetical protein